MRKGQKMGGSSATTTTFKQWQHLVALFVLSTSSIPSLSGPPPTFSCKTALPPPLTLGGVNLCSQPPTPPISQNLINCICKCHSWGIKSISFHDVFSNLICYMILISSFECKHVRFGYSSSFFLLSFFFFFLSKIMEILLVEIWLSSFLPQIFLLHDFTS